MRWVICSGLLGLGVASASPTELFHQGRLLDSMGDPLQGVHQLDIGLYASATGGSAAWSESETLTLSDGYFAATLGDSVSLSGLDFAETSYWVGVSLADGTELLPRTPLAAVPVAMSVVGGGASEADTGPLVFGRVSTGASYGWVPFPRPLSSDPVIIATVNELNDSGAVPNRVVQAGRDGFGWASWNCSASDVADSVSFIAAEPGVHTIDGHTIEAGNAGATSSNAFTITFNATFNQLPVVMLTVDERGNNSGATACRVESLSTTQASGRCWNNSAGDNADGVYFIAMEPTPVGGVSYVGRTLHAGRSLGASSATVNLPAPSGAVGVPGVMALSVEHNGTSGGPSIARTHRASNGTSVETRSWHCPAGEARTPFALHWLFVD